MHRLQLAPGRNATPTSERLSLITLGVSLPQPKDGPRVKLITVFGDLKHLLSLRLSYITFSVPATISADDNFSDPMIRHLGFKELEKDPDSTRGH